MVPTNWIIPRGGFGILQVPARPSGPKLVNQPLPFSTLGVCCLAGVLVDFEIGVQDATMRAGMVATIPVDA